jgi:hypothetical protein
MRTASRLRLALAWEDARVPVVLLGVAVLFAGTLVPTMARLEAAAALTLVPLAAAVASLRSLWNETPLVRWLAATVALGVGGAALAAIWGGAGPWQPALVWGLALLGVAAAGVQLVAARVGARSFFSVGIGIAVALALFAPTHVTLDERPSSVLAALLVALVAGGGPGAAVVALADRFAPAPIRNAFAPSGKASARPRAPDPPTPSGLT